MATITAERVTEIFAGHGVVIDETRAAMFASSANRAFINPHGSDLWRFRDAEGLCEVWAYEEANDGR